jgi:hypothetical protein
MKIKLNRGAYGSVWRTGSSPLHLTSVRQSVNIYIEVRKFFAVRKAAKTLSFAVFFIAAFP